MAFSVAAMAIGFASCSKSTNTGSQNEADVAFVDSISEVSAQFNGAMFAKNIETLPEADQAKFNKEDFLKGLKAVYLADTANLGYIIGMQVGMNMLQQQRMMDQQGVGTNRDLFFKEFSKYFKMDSVPATQMTEMQTALQTMQMKAQSIMSAKMQKQQAAQVAEAEKENKANMEAGKAYVDKQKAADKAIQTTASGLSYKVEKEGTGAKATEKDRVKVKYTGKLIDGTVFDSNDDATFSPKGVVPGFGEGLQLMSKGGKYVLYIPGDLGYGPQGGAGGKIQPGATLVFEVEVLDILPEGK